MSATPMKQLVDAKVVIEQRNASYHPRRGETFAEAKARCLEVWAKEIHEFFRDHRHQEVDNVTVDWVYEDVCSECRRHWDPYLNEDSGNTECPYCGAFIGGPNPPTEGAEDSEPAKAGQP